MLASPFGIGWNSWHTELRQSNTREVHIYRDINEEMTEKAMSLKIDKNEEMAEKSMS